MAVIILRSPPRLSGESSEQQISNINSYMDDLYQGLRLALEVIAQIGAMGAITTAISNPPTQGEVEDIVDKVNAIVELAGQIEL